MVIIPKLTALVLWICLVTVAISVSAGILVWILGSQSMRLVLALGLVALTARYLVQAERRVP